MLIKKPTIHSNTTNYDSDNDNDNINKRIRIENNKRNDRRSFAIELNLTKIESITIFNLINLLSIFSGFSGQPI